VEGLLAPEQQAVILEARNLMSALSLADNTAAGAAAENDPAPAEGGADDASGDGEPAADATPVTERVLRELLRTPATAWSPPADRRCEAQSTHAHTRADIRR
jgi:hypothetical protein